MHSHAREGSPSSGCGASESSKMTVFTMVSATFVQKWQYLQGFLTVLCRNRNIYKVLWRCGPEIAIFGRFSNNAAKKAACFIRFFDISGRKRAKTTVFARFFDIAVQKAQYLQSVQTLPLRSSNIYKDFRIRGRETSDLTTLLCSRMKYDEVGWGKVK